MKIAVYPGSFDPFTKGHLDLAIRASRAFDKVVILIANNDNKVRHFNKDKMRAAISKDIHNYPNISVDYTSGLIADYCDQIGSEFIIRGLRGTSEYMKERDMRIFNHTIAPHIETIYLSSHNSEISSSLVRELLIWGKSMQEFVPSNVGRLIIYEQEKMEGR